jgi:hypothetical protein
MRYVTDLMVLEGRDAKPPSGWKKIDKDLNAGAGGTYLYFAYETGDSLERALKHIEFLGQGQPVPYRYTKIDVDLNKGAHGKYLYAAFTRDPHSIEGSLEPILDLDVIITDNPDVDDNDAGWFTLSQDLNEGAKGKYVFLRCNFPVHHSMLDGLDLKHLGDANV